MFSKKVYIFFHTETRIVKKPDIKKTEKSFENLPTHFNFQ